MPITRPGDHASRTLFTALDAMPTAIIAVTAAGTINYVNPQAVRAFGYEADELIGLAVEALIPVGDSPGHEGLRERYVEDARPLTLGQGRQMEARRKDGSTFPVEVSLTPLPTDDGPWTLAGVVDITERRAAEEKVRGLSRAHLALAELNAALLRIETPRELFAAACGIVRGASPHAVAWVGQRDDSGGVAVTTRGGDVGPVDDVDLLAGLPGLADVFGSAAAWICRDVVAETSGPWRDWAVGAEIVAMVSLALRRDGETVAAFTVLATKPTLLDEEFVSVLETMADNLSLALDRFAARERMQTIDGQRVELLGRLVAAQEDERARIAADVHDHSIQALAALDLRLGLHRNQLRQVAPELIASTDLLQAGLADVIEGLRHLLFDLEAADSTVALIDQLSDALDHVFEQSDLRHTLEVLPGTGATGGPEYADLVPDLRGQAVRIFKEALANVRRHAEASMVRVTVTPDPLGVEIMVADNGVGPTVDVADLRSRPGHRGLDGMRDRAAVAGGWCRIERTDGLTVLRFWLPRTHIDAPAS